MMEILFSGVEFKQNTLRMPSAGSWETKSSEYLRLNPAGTVPLLLHNGHPVYESNDQLKYVRAQCCSLAWLESIWFFFVCSIMGYLFLLVQLVAKHFNGKYLQ